MLWHHQVAKFFKGHIKSLHLCSKETILKKIKIGVFNKIWFLGLVTSFQFDDNSQYLKVNWHRNSIFGGIQAIQAFGVEKQPQPTGRKIPNEVNK